MNLFQTLVRGNAQVGLGRFPRVRVLAMLAILFPLISAGFIAQNATGILSIDSMRTWLTYLSSDDVEGRGTFSEGLGLAAAYIAEQLKEGGVTPGGDHGTYFQRVTVQGIRSSGHSTLTVEVNGQTRTFRDGEGVTFPKFVGANRSFSMNQAEFLGYNPGASKASDFKGKVVIWIENPDPITLLAAEEGGIGAIIIPEAGQERQQPAPPGADFVTSQSLNLPRMPRVFAGNELLNFLFSASNTKYDEIRSKSDRRENLKTFTLKDVKLTFNLAADYQVVSTQFTRNVVGIVEGSDAQLKNTFVAFGAHYDHMGYIQGPMYGATDRIYNGADDDGSGTTALIGLARAFAQGPKPRRSLLFVWHAGEELGLYGSHYFVDHPPAAIGDINSIVTQLNIDMIGRNRDNKASESDTIYAVGADRISTDLHNILVDSNAAMPRPLSLNFEMNDPSDGERIYYRSDHFSYASKGIPIIFFFSGLHPDYHEVTDTVDKIDFSKIQRVGQLVYEIGRRIANADRAPTRDFKGPRAGRGTTGKLAN